MLAVEEGHHNCLSILLANGAEVNCPCTEVASDISWSAVCLARMLICTDLYFLSLLRWGRQL